jgi:hypothetical protein
MVLNFVKKSLSEQDICAQKCIKGIEEGYLFQLVIAQTQSGKTGMMVSIARSVMTRNVVVMTGLSSIDWKKQTISRFPKNIPVYHRNDLKNVKITKNSLILIDEIQYASQSSMTLDMMLSNCECKDVETLTKMNVRFVLVSATPNRIFDDILLLQDEAVKCRILTMRPGKGYVGLRELYDSGRLLDAQDLWVANTWSDDENAGVKRWNSKMISKSLDAIKTLKDFVEEKYEEPVYVVVRTPTALNGETVRKRVMQVFGTSYDYLICDMSTKKDVMTVVKKKPSKTTVLFIKEQLRCAATLHKEYIGVLYDRVSAMDSVMVQGLAGRATGYDVHDKLVVFSHVKSILKYIEIIENSFENFEKMKYSGGMSMMHPESGFVEPKSSVESRIRSV